MGLYILYISINVVIKLIISTYDLLIKGQHCNSSICAASIHIVPHCGTLYDWVYRITTLQYILSVGLSLKRKFARSYPINQTNCDCALK